MLLYNFDEADCFKCKHFKGRKADNEFEKNERMVCKAYPKGIPHQLITGQKHHDKAFYKDNGIRFEPK